LSVTFTNGAFISDGSEIISLAEVISVTHDGNVPAYLVVNGIDRAEYTAAASGITGSLQGNGASDPLISDGGDSRTAGIVFTYQASSGSYSNATYGNLDQMTYHPSSSVNDVTNLSLFGTSSLNLATTDAASTFSLSANHSQGYLGSITIATQPGFSGAVPSQATPSSIAAIAKSFVGESWNMSGCWVLASTIATEAGSSLPVQSNYIGLPGQANGEWIVAFNGPTGQTGNWQSMVTAGEMIVFETASGSGHIATCVSGRGSSALLVDNITDVNSSGKVTNLANDGSISDVVIASPHAASGEFFGANSADVVIYQLDTPIIAQIMAMPTILINSSSSLAALVFVSDPGHKAVIDYQVYEASGQDELSINGRMISAFSAAGAGNANSLASIALIAGGRGSDVVEIRAENSAGYWGDWQAVTITAATSVPSLSAPLLHQQISAQTWLQGHSVSLTLPLGAFSDPQGEALTYSASEANGQALPSWLKFDGSFQSFSGQVPNSGSGSLSLMVTATDISGLSTNELISVTIPNAAPLVAHRITPPSFQPGQSIHVTVPANSFVDPQGLAMTYSASQSGGKDLPSWLNFTPASETFNGIAPANAQSQSITVTATDSAGLSSSEVAFSVVAPSPLLTSRTADQVWQSGAQIDFALPSNVFTDPQAGVLTFDALQTGGHSAASWLHFNSASLHFSGTVPQAESGAIAITIEVYNSSGRYNSESFDISFGNGATNVMGQPSPVHYGNFALSG
jgi:hypothetical protein